MGGLLAQLTAARVPCQRLILLSSAAPAGINGMHLSVLRTLGSNLFLFPLWRKTTALKLANVQYGVTNPFPWMSEIMDLRKEKNFFETRVTEYQVGGALNWD